METRRGTIAAQALLGLVAVVVAYVLGMIIAASVPGTGWKYLNDMGEIAVGTWIFLAMLCLWIVARFAVTSMFITTGLLFALMLVLRVALDAEPDIGRCVMDLFWIGRHTVLPLFCAALVLWCIRSSRRRADDASK